MIDPEEAMAVVAKRLAAHYRISPVDALRHITNALVYAPELSGVEGIYWFSAGWLAGRGRDSNTAFIPAPRDQRKPKGRW